MPSKEGKTQGTSESRELCRPGRQHDEALLTLGYGNDLGTAARTRRRPPSSPT